MWTLSISSLLCLGANTAHAFTTSYKQISDIRTAITELQMYESVEAAIAEAQRICADDPSSDECRVAWDIVEELEAADSHIGGPTAVGETDMDASATLMLGSFDILTQKINGKMDQLRATAEQLESMGAPGDMPELVRLANEMQVALANARSELNL